MSELTENTSHARCERKGGHPGLFHKLVMLILKDFGRRLGVVEQLVYLLDLLPLHALFSLNSAKQTGRRQQLYGVPERKRKKRDAQYTHILTTEVRVRGAEDPKSISFTFFLLKYYSCDNKNNTGIYYSFKYIFFSSF